MPRRRIDVDALSGPKVDRRTTIKVLTAAGFSGLAGCMGGDDDEDDGTDTDDSNGTAESGSAGGRLQAAWWTGSVDELDPAYIGVGIYFSLATNIFNGLVKVNENLEFVGDLAEDWTVEDDGERFIFDLRDDVVFHNGNEFTAEDVQYTIERNIELDAPHNLGSVLDDEGVVVEDDYTVELNWVEPMASVLALLTGGPGRAATIVNQEAYEEMGADQYSIEPVGTGPFEVAEHNPGNEIILDAFDDYFETDDEGNQLPYLDGVDISLIPEAGTLVNAVQAGDIQFTNLVPLESAEEVENASGVGISRVLGNTWAGVMINHDREPYDQLEARLGIAKAIDNEQFVQDAYFGNALANTGVFSQNPEWVWREPEERPDDQEYDPEGSQELLEEAGLFDQTVSILAYDENLRASRILSQQLEAVGLETEIDQVTTSTFWDRFSFDGEYELTLSGSVDKPDPEESIWNFYRLPDEDGVWNWSMYENQEFHDLLGEQRQQMDQDERAATLAEAEDILIEDVASAYLGHQEDICAIRDEVDGFVHIPAFERRFLTVSLNE